MSFESTIDLDVSGGSCVQIQKEAAVVIVYLYILLLHHGESGGLPP